MRRVLSSFPGFHRLWLRRCRYRPNPRCRPRRPKKKCHRRFRQPPLRLARLVSSKSNRSGWPSTAAAPAMRRPIGWGGSWTTDITGIDAEQRAVFLILGHALGRGRAIALDDADRGAEISP